MKLLDRIRGIEQRMAKVDPVAEPIRQIFLESKRKQLLDGRDLRGEPFQPLAASTLRYRHGSPTPLVPQGEHSRIITHYEVTLTPEWGRLRIQAGWHDLDWVKYHVTGNPRLPKRDPSGLKPEATTEALRMWRDWVLHG